MVHTVSAIYILIRVGKNAIVNSDIKHQLKEAIGFYEFNFVRIDLSSESEIIKSLKAYDKNTEIIVIARGGGENMEVFNRTSLAEEALSLRIYNGNSELAKFQLLIFDHLSL